MARQSSPAPGATGAFNETVLDYFAAHGIDPEVAEAVGVRLAGGLRFPYRDGSGIVRYERKRDMSEGTTYQPRGESLEPWMPVGTGSSLLALEGESDELAVLSAMYGPDDAGTDLVRRDDLPPPLADLVPVALPGAGVCHGRLADIAEAEEARVLIAFDGDDAGRLAAKKLKKGISTATIIELPDGLDMADVLAAADDPTATLAEMVAEAEAVVEEVSGEGDASGEEAAEIEPLPPESIAGLLDQALDFLARYVVLPDDADRYAVALWLAHTWGLDGAHATPYLLILSPERRSGKTRLQETVELLAARPWRVTGASEAAVFRKIEQSRPTLLLDEIDAIFGSHSERTEPLRAILNAGNRPGAAVARVVGEGHEVRDFSVFGAKALAGIDKGHLIPDTIRDRSIAITMQRKTAAEPVERFRFRVADAEAQPIRDGLERWAVGAVDLLLAANPDLSHELDDRAAEAWEPLLAIADMAGGDWPERARAAALALSSDGDRDEVTTGTLLLGAIREVFGEGDRITTTDLLSAINADEELPFGGWRDGNGIDGRRLARLLKPYGIRPRTIRVGDRTEKGYMRETFTEPWSRWLPTCTEPSQRSQPSHDTAAVTQKPHNQADVTDVTAVTDRSHGDGTVTAAEAEEAELLRIAAKLGSAA
ncbi:MAG: DUF3631 domain-containing protein [Solirubrobacterales bacterium]